MTAAGSIEARLYDARGADRPINLFRDPTRRLRDHQLLWVDIAGRDPATLKAIAEPLGLAPSTVEALGRAGDRPLVRRHDDYIHAGFRSAEAAPDGSLDVVGLDLVAAPNIVLTVRDGLVAALLISSVLGMNFGLPFFDDPANFWVSLGGMAALIAGTIAVVVLRDRD